MIDFVCTALERPGRLIVSEKVFEIRELERRSGMITTVVGNGLHNGSLVDREILLWPSLNVSLIP